MFFCTQNARLNSKAKKFISKRAQRLYTLTKGHCIKQCCIEKKYFSLILFLISNIRIPSLPMPNTTKNYNVMKLNEPEISLLLAIRNNRRPKPNSNMKQIQTTSGISYIRYSFWNFIKITHSLFFIFLFLLN